MVSSLIVAASALLAITAAAPVQDDIRSGSLEARQAPSCNIGTKVHDSAAYNSACWDTLNIMPYLSNWKAATPTCTDAENSAGQTLGCCVASEPWSTCFLRLATRVSNAHDCTKLDQSTCSFPIDLDAALDPTIASQVNYIVLNIAMINSFFASYYNSLVKQIPNEEASLKTLASSVPSQLHVLDVGVNTQNAIAAMTLGLAFPEFSTPKNMTVSDDGTTTTATSTKKRDPQDTNTGTSSSPAPQGSSVPSAYLSVCLHSWVVAYFQRGHHKRQQPDNCPNEGHYESNPSDANGFRLDSDAPPVLIFNAALQQSPNVALAMWPSPPNTATDTVASAMFPSPPDPATDTISNLAGLLSASVSNTLNAGLQLIMNDIGTFAAFAGDGIFSTPLLPTDEASAFTQGFTGALDTWLISQILASNSISATPGSIVATNPCSSGPLCPSSYWSPVTGRQYSFTGSDTQALIHSADTTTEVDLPVLFDGAYNCTYKGLAGGSVVSLKGDSSLNVACLSVLPMYIDGDCPEGAVQVGGKCPFGHV